MIKVETLVYCVSFFYFHHLLISKTFTTFALDSAMPNGWVGQDIMDSVLYRSYMT